MDVHEALLRPRRLQQRIAAGRHLAEPGADGEDQIGFADAPRQLRIDADADIARIERMVVVEQVLEAKRAADRELPAFGEALERHARRRVPAAAADDREGPLGGHQQRA